MLADRNIRSLDEKSLTSNQGYGVLVEGNHDPNSLAESRSMVSTYGDEDIGNALYMQPNIQVQSILANKSDEENEERQGVGLCKVMQALFGRPLNVGLGWHLYSHCTLAVSEDGGRYHGYLRRLSRKHLIRK